MFHLKYPPFITCGTRKSQVTPFLLPYSVSSTEPGAEQDLLLANISAPDTFLGSYTDCVKLKPGLLESTIWLAEVIYTDEEVQRTLPEKADLFHQLGKAEQ